MTISLNATVGSASANSFVTEAEADAYLEARPNSGAWTGTTTKQQALIQSTRLLSALTWQGTRVDATQALSWPRQWVQDLDAPVGTTYFATTVVPQWLKDATCELALEVLKAGTTDLFALPSTEGVIQKTVGPLTTVYADPTLRKTELRRYPMVWQLISRYVLMPGFQVQTVRG